MSLSIPPRHISEMAPAWFTQLWQAVSGMQQAGTTAQRPTKNLWIGRPYYDTTLHKPIWHDGTIWRDSAGVAA